MRKKPQPLPVKSNLTVEELPIESIREYPNNSRMHTVEQIELIARGITEFGWTNPILIDVNSEIVAGHARLQAARNLGMTTVPTIRLGHLTPDQKRAYVIFDNKSAQTGTQWDYTLLKLELSELKLADFDLQLSGWSEAEIEQLFTSPIEAAKEWGGMPEYDQADKLAFHSVIVNFRNQEAIEAFSKLVEQPITRKTRSSWYPYEEMESIEDQRYET